jgi:hypothetical protein
MLPQSMYVRVAELQELNAVKRAMVDSTGNP